MWQVFLKELLELSRDRKTLMFVILLPLAIFPVIFLVMGLVAATVTKDLEKQEHTYVIINADKAPAFAEKLFYHKNFKKVSTDLTTVEQLKEAIKAEKFSVAVIIPADYDENSAQWQQSKWQLVYNSATQLDIVGRKMRELVDEYSEAIQTRRLASAGIEGDAIKAVLKPVELSKVSTAEAREDIGEKLGGFIAYLLVPLCLMGCVTPALDIAAGEKERGTLETLLICPVERSALVLGKFLTVITAGILTALIMIISFGGWGYVAGSLMGVDLVAKLMSSLGVVDLALILLMLLPLTMIFGSLVLALSIYARSFKEAQSYTGPLFTVVFIPLVIALLPGVELNVKTALIPVTNISLVIKELVKGTIDYAMLAVVLGSSALLAAVLMYYCTRWFQRESVLFR